MGKNVPATELFFLVLILVFSVPYLVWRIGRTDHWAPLVWVQIVTEILLGPAVLGAAFPEVGSAVFTPQVISALIHAVMDIGLILLAGAGEAGEPAIAVISCGYRYPASTGLALRIAACVILDAAGAECAVDARQRIGASISG